MRYLSPSETLITKSEMEKIMAQSGQTNKHYHDDKSIFADNGFVDAINEKNQKLTFCGVGTHHQNGIIENKNKMLNRCKKYPHDWHQNMASNY